MRIGLTSSHVVSRNIRAVRVGFSLKPRMVWAITHLSVQFARQVSVFWASTSNAYRYGIFVPFPGVCVYRSPPATFTVESAVMLNMMLQIQTGGSEQTAA